MKYYIYLLTILLVSCGEPAQSPSSPYKVDSLPAPDHVTIPYTTAEIPHEKHFDCWIVEKITGNRDDEDMYVTECGIAFYSDRKYTVGDTLKNFQSPKHK
jgi:hypothetical protein